MFVDLVPVSSTVIPLPIYKVSSAGYNIKPLKDELNQRPKGPVSLITGKLLFGFITISKLLFFIIFPFFSEQQKTNHSPGEKTHSEASDEESLNYWTNLQGFEVVWELIAFKHL